MKSGKTADAAAAEYTIPAAYEGYTPNADQTKSNVAVIYKSAYQYLVGIGTARRKPLTSRLAPWLSTPRTS